MGHYRHLSLKERRQIGAFIEMGCTIKDISQKLNRHRATIYRELERNQTKEGYYFPHQAHSKAQKRHYRKPLKLVVNSVCYKYVMKKLKSGWSPEQISGRMRKLSLPYRVCHETIYQYIYRHAQSHIYYYLPMQRCRRKLRQKRQTRHIFRDFRSIDNRPKEVEARCKKGHWEGDTIRFANERYQSITTLVERKSRFVLLQKNIRSTTKIVMTNIRNIVNLISNRLCKTITFDQGSEFADFACIERHTKCNVYYAHAHSPWLRGTNENTNKRIRRYLPKQTNIKGINQSMLNTLADQLNNTPRKCLGFLTPKEVFLGHKKKIVALDSVI